MRVPHGVSVFVVYAVLLVIARAGMAQGPPGHDENNPPPGHGGMPPGQAKKHQHGENGMPPGQARKYGEGEAALPPGQAKKHFRDGDRERFYSYYRDDADRWRARKRPVFWSGRYIAPTYVIRSVPRTVWVGVVAAPPPGYEYGYCRGYIVAYNPTNRMVADVLDLIATAASR